jgi:hypothetical protein
MKLDDKLKLGKYDEDARQKVVDRCNELGFDITQLDNILPGATWGPLTGSLLNLDEDGCIDDDEILKEQHELGILHRRDMNGYTIWHFLRYCTHPASLIAFLTEAGERPTAANTFGGINGLLREYRTVAEILAPYKPTTMVQKPVFWWWHYRGNWMQRANWDNNKLAIVTVIGILKFRRALFCGGIRAKIGKEIYETRSHYGWATGAWRDYPVVWDYHRRHDILIGQYDDGCLSPDQMVLWRCDE